MTHAGVGNAPERQRFPVADSMLPVVDAVVVTWNATDDTIACVRSLMASASPLRRLRVVDNGSDRDTVAALEEALPDVDLIESPANLGFAGGCNLGISASLREDADFVWIVNNDAVVESGSLGALLDAMCLDGITGIVGSRVVYADEPNLIWHEGGIVNTIRGIAFNAREGEAADPPGPPSDTPYVSGCSMLLRATALRGIGAFDTRFFLYFEDVEICLRAARLGWRVVVQPRSVVHHKVSASTSRIPDRVAFLKDRNRTLFAICCAGGRWTALMATAYHGARAVRYWLIPRAGQTRGASLLAFRSGVRSAFSTHDNGGETNRTSGS